MDHCRVARHCATGESIKTKQKKRNNLWDLLIGIDQSQADGFVEVEDNIRRERRQVSC